MDELHVSRNRLLSDLGPGEAELVIPYLRRVDLVQGAEIATAGDELADVYFPHNGIISLVNRLANGDAAEVAMVGRDSVFGASAALVGPKALTTAIVQSPGACSILSVRQLKEAIEQNATLRTILIRHEQAIFLQAQQSVGCIASHPGLARLARWLLSARDAGGTDEFTLTREFLGQILGLKRNAVSTVASALQDNGMIQFSRGRIRISDAAAMKAITCECYFTVRNELARLKGPSD